MLWKSSVLRQWWVEDPKAIITTNCDWTEYTWYLQTSLDGTIDRELNWVKDLISKNFESNPAMRIAVLPPPRTHIQKLTNIYTLREGGWGSYKVLLASKI